MEEDVKAPKIEFPCPNYPIRVVGDAAGSDYLDLIYDTVVVFVPDLAKESMESKPSRKGNYISVSFTFTAQSKEHIEDIFTALKATGRVRLVL